MPATLTLPAEAKRYNQPFTPLPYHPQAEPAEGRRFVSIPISWGGASADTTTGVLSVDLGSQAVSPLSQFKAVYVDNSQNGADVTLIFPDTQFELTVPVGKGGLYPVVSGLRTFYVVSSNAISGDKTFLQCFNFEPPLIDISRPAFTNGASSGLLALTVGTTALISASVVGTLSGLVIEVGNVVGGGAAGQANISVVDHTAAPTRTIAAVTVGGGAGFVVPAAQLFARDNLDWRFQGGVDVVVTFAGTAFATSAMFVSATYRQP